MLSRINRIFRRTAVRSVLISVISGMGLLFVLDRLFPLPEERIFRQPSHFIYSREGHLLRAFSSSDQYWRMPVELDGVSPLMQKSVLVSEDRWFYYHLGCNPVSIVAAAYDNIKAGRTIRGGSTITMQIARMIEPK